MLGTVAYETAASNGRTATETWCSIPSEGIVVPPFTEKDMATGVSVTIVVGAANVAGNAISSYWSSSSVSAGRSVLSVAGGGPADDPNNDPDGAEAPDGAPNAGPPNEVDGMGGVGAAAWPKLCGAGWTAALAPNSPPVGWGAGPEGKVGFAGT